MVDNMGRVVVSSNRLECHFGLTPGGCTDHPGVWQHMTEFFTQVVTRYRSAPNLRGLGCLERAAMECSGRRSRVLLPEHPRFIPPLAG